MTIASGLRILSTNLSLFLLIFFLKYFSEFAFTNHRKRSRQVIREREGEREREGRREIVTNVNFSLARIYSRFERDERRIQEIDELIHSHKRIF